MTSKKILLCAMIAVAISLFSNSQSHAQLYNLNWIGTGGTNNISLLENWVADSRPPDQATMSDLIYKNGMSGGSTMTFGQLGVGGTYTVELKTDSPAEPNAGDWLGGGQDPGDHDGLIFTQADQGYTFNLNAVSNPNYLALYVPDGQGTLNVRNFSTQTQTFNVRLYMRNGTVDAANGPFVFTAGVTSAGNNTIANKLIFQGDYNITLSGLIPDNVSNNAARAIDDALFTLVQRPPLPTPAN